MHHCTGAAPESLSTVELYCAVELWKEVQFVEDQLDSIELKAAAILLHHCQKNQQLRYYEDIGLILISRILSFENISSEDIGIEIFLYQFSLNYLQENQDFRHLNAIEISESSLISV